MQHIRTIINNNNGQGMRASGHLEQQLVHRQFKVQVLATMGVLLPCGPGAEILVVVVLSCAPVAYCPSGHGGDLLEGTRCSELPADRVNVLGPMTSLVRCSKAWCSAGLLHLTSTSQPGRRGDNGVGQVIDNSNSWSSHQTCSDATVKEIVPATVTTMTHTGKW